jgi:hypothetical protein
MAWTPPYIGVDNQTANAIVVGTQDDSVGMPAKSLDYAVERLEQKFRPDDEGKMTCCSETRKWDPSNPLSIVFLLVSYCQQ